MKELINQLTDFQLTLLVVLGVCVFIQLLYIFMAYFRLVFYKPKNVSESNPPVSVVICARNESTNLMNHIPIIMEQDYPQFEVVVVNDISWDDSEDILKALSVRYQNLKVLKIDEDKHRMTGKKFALTMGIKAASHDQLVLTDADCKPLNKQWLSLMMSERTEEKNVVLGVSLLARQKGFWKNMFRFESVHTAVNYCSFALARNPYMGVGRNLSYTKELFFSVGGFRSHMHIQGGDDDLFINEISTKTKIAVMPLLAAQTESESPKKFKNWWLQKRRHLSTSSGYKFKHKFLLGLEPLSWWIMWTSAVILFIVTTNPLLVITPLALRYALVYGTFIAIGKKWNAIDAVWTFPFWEACLNILKPTVLLSNVFSKPKRWM
ncbi:MAG: glycosyltransferase [Flavobacteriales bacterium]